VAAVTATASLGLTAAAYGRSPSFGIAGDSMNASGSANSQLLAFSRCMRSHGVFSFPDPQAGQTNAKFPDAQQLGVSSSQYQAAYNACQHLLPAGTDDQYPPAEVQLLLIGMLKFSSCMRSHGVPNFPDPATDSEGRPEFPLENVPGTSRSYWHSPRINHAISECQHLLPTALGGMPIG
jgi:hypothetical protein